MLSEILRQVTFKAVRNQRLVLSVKYFSPSVKQHQLIKVSDSKAHQRVGMGNETHSTKNRTMLLKVDTHHGDSFSGIRTLYCGEEKEANNDSEVGEDHDYNGKKDRIRRIANSASLADFKTKLQKSGDFTLSHQEWKELRNDACAENPNLHKSWETLCMQLMWHHACPQLATSLIDYIRSEASPKLATLALYIGLQGSHGAEDKESIILKSYSEINKITDVFDSTTAKYLISGLSVTSKWRETVDILEIAKLTGSTGTVYYSPIVAAAFRNNDQDLAFKQLDELGQKGLQPQDCVLLEILQVCKDIGDNTLLEKYFTYAWRYNWLPSQHLAKELELHFTGSAQEEMQCRWTHIHSVKGTCMACNHQLERTELLADDFEALQKTFLEKALVGSDVYLRSNPKEVERFKNFVRKNAPFDVVLDALNIAFKGGENAKTRLLREVVSYFTQEKHMQVLVIGRAHMLKWPQADMRYIHRHSKVFLTDNVSSDDPFCLYAALASGKNCMFMSSDFMRDHKYNLGVHLKEAFVRWQKSRQIINFNFSNKGVFVMMPSMYDCGPVKDNKGWHLPYAVDNISLKSTSQPVLCLRYCVPHRASPKPLDKEK